MPDKQNGDDCIFIAEGGEMGDLMREKDWSTSPLGNPGTWPQSLRTSVNIMLNTRYPMFLWWGPELLCFYNDAYRKSLGQQGKHPAILGMRAEEAWPEIWATIKPMIDKVLAGKGANWNEDALIPIFRNGKIEDVYWTFSYSPAFDEDCKIAGVLVTCNETTEKVDTIKKLQESEERFRMMADNIPNLAWMAHADGAIYWYNSKWYEYTGTTPSEMEGWGWQSVHDPEKLPDVLEKWKGSIATGQPFEMIFPLKAANARFGHFLTRVLPMKNQDGIITQWFGTNTDITKQLETEQAVRMSEMRFKEMITRAPVGIGVVMGPSFILETANNRLLEILGKTEDVLNKPVFEGMPDAAGQGFEQLLTGVYTTGKAYVGSEMPVSLLRNGKQEMIYTDFVYEPMLDVNGRTEGIISIATDVTEHVEAKERLKRSAEHLKVVLESLPPMSWTALPDGYADFFTENWSKFTGLSLEESVGDGWTKAIHPDYKEGVVLSWKTAQANNSPVEHEFKLLGSDGTDRWVWVKGVPIKNENGEALLWVGTVTDIQDRKHFSEELERQVQERTTELEFKNDELVRMNKELQAFSYIAGHDLQEPLRKIRIFSDQILETESANLSSGGKDRFARMQNAAKRMQTLIDDLLAYSRTTTAEKKFEFADLTLLAEEVRAELKEELLAKNAVLEIEPLCSLNVIPFQIRQVLHNLLSNSIKFTPPERTPHIKIRSNKISGADLNNKQLSAGKTYCHISITDNGIGFEEQYRDKIFELFQRLNGKAEYAGTGIGLAIVKKIIEIHEGAISATSELDKGATFDIYLPIEE